MSSNFEELDFQPTALGDLILRRRRLLSLGRDVFEVKLGDAFLMSSLFHVVEEALADLALRELQANAIDVVVGGLGLGYTAAAALRDDRVASLLVVDALQPVIRWHEEGLVPLGKTLTTDQRCRFVHGDFFALAVSQDGFDPRESRRRFHAVLLDIDHSPRNLLDPRHASFYTPTALSKLASHLHDGGIFALWSDDPPDEEFLEMLDDPFGEVRSHVVTFPNPLLDTESASTVYVARKAGKEST